MSRLFAKKMPHEEKLQEFKQELIAQLRKRTHMMFLECTGPPGEAGPFWL